MSDGEEVFDDTRYSTPVPELDDHRHQSASVQRPDRSRRGTVDTLYGQSARNYMTDLDQVDAGLLNTSTYDYEEAVIDDGGHSPVIMPNRSRRPTAASADSRDHSPPNSVKAFAQARRRERDSSPATSVRAFADARRNDEPSSNRRLSVTSEHSRRSIPHHRHTNDNDHVSVAPSKRSIRSIEDDVCFPQPIDDRRDKRNLYIDFDYLEDFIKAEEHDHTPPKNQPAPRLFQDLRSQSSNAQAPKIMDMEGNLIEIPSGESLVKESGAKEFLANEKQFGPAQHVDPNRFSFFSSSWQSTIHAAEFGDLILPGEDVRGLFTMPDDDEDGVWWLNMNNPSEEEVRAICKAFGIHPLTIEDIEKQEAREKIELFPAYYFACFRSFNMILEEDGDREPVPYNMYVIVFREGTLSFSFAPNPHAASVRARITKMTDYIALSSDWICYALIDDIVDSFEPTINQIGVETDAIEDQVFIARTDDMHSFLRKIGESRKTVMALMKLLGGKADILRGFTKRCNENYRVTPRMDIGLYLGDIQDHVVTMMSNLGHYEKMLSRAHGNYLAQLQIDNITQGNRSNKVLSKITLLASILVPLNLVCGMFGMNVKVPFGGKDTLVPFFTILGFLATFTLLSIVVARRLRYL